MTPEIIRERAFFLYLIGGESFNSIAITLRSEFGTRTTAKSVQTWATKKDSIGMTWEDRRKVVTQKAESHIEVVAENRLVEIRSRTKKIIDTIYESMISANAPGIKTLEGAAYAFKTLAEFETKLSDMEDSKVSPMMLIQSFFNALMKCKPVSVVIEKHWDEINKIIRDDFINVSSANTPTIKNVTDR
ncbi:hypothetical protein EHQ43_08720 [Leptospira bouyouniensis]|uniref:Uncharacterized protein n=1 Tax=Leptospira bouyouniensis TaxID=2484911 RepID=A0A7I0HSL8_9LEPT|nr:hypothetical protein [Leptospira bouyouniensis]TGL06485.1 hypothetical protein EHQ43_08720 [Leptospira bouyouniensis]